MASRHKNRVTKRSKTYAERRNAGAYDAIEGDEFGDGQTPWSSPPLSDVEYDKIDGLYDLYDILEGREKQVLRLLLQGETNHYTIAKVLNMKRPNVTICIKEIRKKALEYHTKHTVL